MATQKSIKNAVASKAKSATLQANSNNQGLKGLVKQMKPAIEAALKGTGLEPARFTRLVMSTLSSNPKLQACTPESFCAAMMSAAQLGLEPDTALGQAYLIPYGKQCQFQLGYAGLIELAFRSGKINKIDAQVVYENDEFEYALGWDSKLIHVPAFQNRGNAIGVYALYKTVDGGGNFCFMSIEDIKKHAQKFSKSFRNGPWQTDFESMAKKTVIKQVLKYAPISVEANKAIKADEAIKELHFDKTEELKDLNILDVPPEYEVIEDDQIESEPTEKIQKDLQTEIPFT